MSVGPERLSNPSTPHIPHTTDTAQHNPLLADGGTPRWHMCLLVLRGVASTAPLVPSHCHGPKRHQPRI